VVFSYKPFNIKKLTLYLSMKKIIYKYLDKNYKMTLSTPSSFLLYNKKTKSDEGLHTAIQNMSKIFSAEEEDIYLAFEEWCDKETILINNKVVEYQNKIYLETGKTFDLNIKVFNNLLLGEESNLTIF
jgi:hypothetical protein